MHPDGRVDPNGQTHRALQENAAETLGADIAAVKAVAAVESQGIRMVEIDLKTSEMKITP
ncbi:hypothetical protein ACNKU7_15205 [Microbulbifer sp. SA54]|uniref:hypothetical protein n=1 Tax=Microbulbifer sp. SA54 TaxID=3401577 RepID=UPI003AAB61F8